MDKNELIEYLKCTYILELTLYCQKSLYTKIKEMIYKIKNKQYADYYPKKSKKGLFTEYWNENRGLFICLLIITMAVGFIFCISVEMEILLNINIYYAKEAFGILFISAIIAFSVLMLYQYLKKLRKVDFENRNIDLKNIFIEIENRKDKIIDSSKVQLILEELQKVNNMKKQTSEELQKYYNMNIICPHYRYMEAVGFFYGYFCSGRCQTIAEAYKIFEEELKQGWAVDNFSDFEEIRCNRKCALYEDISECDKMVESITEHIESEINKINQA